MIARFLRAGLWAAAAGAATLFAALGLRRLPYPLELDCIEGVMMDHIVRLAQGQPIYVEPTLSFIPLAYMPLFPAVGAVLALVFEPHLWVPRLVSLLSALALAGLVAGIVKRETGGASLAAGAGGLYLMGFGLTGSSYDVARPDSLMIALSFSGLAVLRFTRGRTGALAAALLLVLAFFTKQHALWFVVAAALHLAVNDRRRFAAFAAAAAGGCAGGFALLSWWLGPWFGFYTVHIPSLWSEPSAGRMLQYVRDTLLGSIGLLTVPALLSLGLPARPWRGPGGLWVWAGLGAVGTGLMATLDPSAYRHVVMATLAAMCVLGPISLHRLAAATAAPGAPVPGAANAAVCAALVLQFVPLVYPVRDQLPHRRAREAYLEFTTGLRRQPGRVLVPYHGFYEWSAGKGMSLHIIPLDDILRARGNRLLARDPRFFERLFEPLRRGPDRPAIVTDVPLARSGPLWASLEGAYRLAGDLGWVSEPLRPVSGNRFTPSYLYLPRETGALGGALPALPEDPAGGPGSPPPPRPAGGPVSVRAP